MQNVFFACNVKRIADRVLQHTDPTTGARLIVDYKHKRAEAIVGNHISCHDCATLADFARLFKAAHEAAKQLGLTINK